MESRLKIFSKDIPVNGKRIIVRLDLNVPISNSKIDDDQLFYCLQRGINEEDAVALIINGFCKEVLQALPMEFALEAQKLVAISLEGSVG